MTVIAWDGKTLAADSQSSFGNLPTYGEQKIFRITNNGRTILFGATGRGADCVTVRRWLEGSRDKPDQVKDTFCAMAITEDRRIWQMMDDFVWAHVNKKFYACGSGVDYALGAMAHGATAEQAVRIACSLDVYCGGEIRRLTF